MKTKEMFNDYLNLSTSISEDPYECTGEIIPSTPSYMLTVKKYEYNNYLKEFPEDDLNLNREYDRNIYKFITEFKDAKERTDLYCVLNFFEDKRKLISIEFKNKFNEKINYHRNVYQCIKPSVIDERIAELMINSVMLLYAYRNNIGQFYKKCPPYSNYIVSEACVKLTEKEQQERIRHYIKLTNKCPKYV